MRARSVREQIDRVLRNDNCSGCGGCSIFSEVELELNDVGFLRPKWDASAEEPDPLVARKQARLFRQVCPGVSVTAPNKVDAKLHPTLGQYYSVWAAWSSDAVVRHSGSSGGVLTALSTWIIESGISDGVVASAQDVDTPQRTVALTLRTKSEVLEAAGSRYAPVSTTSLWAAGNEAFALVGKPCEISAARRLASLNAATVRRPILLSFFCAGTPSQDATEDLVKLLDVPADDVASVRYRGNGWPGQFVVTSKSDGRQRGMSYEVSWGEHLGRALQSRCKICPDGTGGHADISVGDFWSTNDAGYPAFDDRAGVSVAIARTDLGQRLLMGARSAGVIALEPIDPEAVAAIQPLQTQRMRTLLGRLAGRLGSGRRVPCYRGYRLFRLALGNPGNTAKAARGAYWRSVNRS